MAGRGRDWQYRRKRKRTRAAAVLPPLILLLLLPSHGTEVFLTRIGPIWPDLGQNRPYQPIWLGYRIGISEQQYPIRIRTGRYATLRPFFKTLLVYNANDGTRSLLITVVFFFSVFLLFFWSTSPTHRYARHQILLCLLLLCLIVPLKVVMSMKKSIIHRL